MSSSLQGAPRLLRWVSLAGRYGLQPGTDATIGTLVPYLEPGDILVDGGNAHFPDTVRSEAALREVGIHFVGAGISGGEEGALKGPSIMPGGPDESYDSLGPSSWRRIVGWAALNGVSTPVFGSSLNYYDAVPAKRLPAALIQGQRDYFGVHTYPRVDSTGTFHTIRSRDRSEVSQ